MKIFNKIAFIFVLATSFSLNSAVSFAEEAASAPASSSAEVISHIDKALVEISKSDFSAAQVHLKAARTASEKLADSSENAKKAHGILIQGQILAKKGDIANSPEELNKAKALYKAL